MDAFSGAAAAQAADVTTSIKFDALPAVRRHMAVQGRDVTPPEGFVALWGAARGLLAELPQLRVELVVLPEHRQQPWSQVLGHSKALIGLLEFRHLRLQSLALAPAADELPSRLHLLQFLTVVVEPLAPVEGGAG